MSKAYKGHELLKEIANGNIKEGTQFKNLNENPMYDNRNIYVYKNNNLIGRFGGMNIIAILNDDFEIIEEEQEIDIQGIEELSDYNNGIGQNRDKINELIKAIKQLDKQINNK